MYLHFGPKSLRFYVKVQKSLKGQIVLILYEVFAFDEFLGSSCNYMKYCTFVFLQSDPKSLCFYNIAQKLRLLHFGPKVVVIACWPKLSGEQNCFVSLNENWNFHFF